MASKHTTEERIAHFLRLAEDPGATQSERDLAAAQAERLMLKHGIEEIDLTTGLPRAEEIIKRQIFFAGSYSTARMSLAFAVAGVLKLKSYHQTIDASSARFYARLANARGLDETQREHAARYVDHASGKRAAGELFTLVGYESDVHDGLALIASIDTQSAVALRQWWAEEGKHTPLRTPRRGYSSWTTVPSEAVQQQHIRVGFIEGFGNGAAERIKEMRWELVQEAEAAHPGTALALVNKEQAVKDWLAGNTKLVQGRSRRSYANRAGTQAGLNANVGGRGIGAGQRSINA